MKLVVVGKGGVGKTTTAAVLARTLARSGHEVVALDCDTNPNLGLSLGIGEERAEAILAARQALDDGDGAHAPAWDEILDRFGAPAPDGVTFAVVNRIDHPDPGCPCCGLSPEQLLREVDRDDLVLLADLEAGIGTLTRLGDEHLDVVLVVVDPAAKALEVGRRAIAVARQHAPDQLLVVANRVRNDEDLAAVLAALPEDVPVFSVPEDPAVTAAEREGRAPLDAAPDAPAVRALVGLADELALAG